MVYKAVNWGKLLDKMTNDAKYIHGTILAASLDSTFLLCIDKILHVTLVLITSFFAWIYDMCVANSETLT